MTRHARKPDVSARKPDVSGASHGAEQGLDTGPGVTGRGGDDRPHLMTIAIGALDARINHIDYFDTSGGEEVLRWYRRRRAQHQRRTPHLRKRQA